MIRLINIRFCSSEIFRGAASIPLGKSASVPILEELGDLPNLTSWGVKGCELPESSIVHAFNYNYNGGEGRRDLKEALFSKLVRLFER